MSPGLIATDDRLLHPEQPRTAATERKLHACWSESWPYSAWLDHCSTSLDAGVPLRDVQEAASHADPRTTMRYDPARVSLDRHATYIVAAYDAGAAR